MRRTPAQSRQDAASSHRLTLGRFTVSMALGIGGAFLWHTKLRHSGSIDQFVEHLVDERGEPSEGRIKVTSLGSTVMLVDDGTTQLLIDAFISPAGLLDATLLGMATDEGVVDSVLNRVGAARIAAIFVSHSHHDHALDVEYIAQRTGASIYGSSSTRNIACHGRLRDGQFQALPIDEPVKVGAFAVQALPSKHSSPVLGREGAAIDKPVRRRACVWAYKEGGTFDILVTHGNQAILFKSSANYRASASNQVKVDTLFLAVAGLGRGGGAEARRILDATVGTLQPSVVVPTHWNDFFRPATPHPPLQRKFIDNVALALERVIAYSAGVCDRRVAILDVFSSIFLEPIGRSKRIE